VEVELLYLDGCPSWQLARDRVGEALQRLGAVAAVVSLTRVTSAEDAAAVGFAGSPTLRVDGRDLFPGTPVAGCAAACRVYPTPDGPAGAPTVDQLVGALIERSPT
jgi:hypothetical protein